MKMMKKFLYEILGIWHIKKVVDDLVELQEKKLLLELQSEVEVEDLINLSTTCDL